MVEPGPTKDSFFRPLFSDELVLVTSPIHNFAQKSSIRVSEIDQERLILYNKASRTFLQIEQFMRDHRATLSNVIELRSMEAIKELVKINFGISFMANWSVQKELTRGSLTQIPMGRKRIHRNWGIAYAKEKSFRLLKRPSWNL